MYRECCFRSCREPSSGGGASFSNRLTILFERHEAVTSLAKLLTMPPMFLSYRMMSGCAACSALERDGVIGGIVQSSVKSGGGLDLIVEYSSRL